MKSNPPTLVVVAVMVGPKLPGPRPSASMLTRIVAGPCPPVGASHACTTTPVGAIAISPKLQPLVPGIVCSGPKPVTAPSPVTADPRATIWPLWFHTTHTATGAPGAVVFAETIVG